MGVLGGIVFTASSVIRCQNYLGKITGTSAASSFSKVGLVWLRAWYPLEAIRNQGDQGDEGDQGVPDTK
ncbi:hypothetical protein BofuT4_uP110680.1 [Botrytis cinerea T4]|uniref:Uncharacterized protein n=1 Tax=Botryotinia fuckeliana (strain T4) TaxID=999810 RepID=G2Y603_BOTF4|nr:hypothetical protein BofuT4_uP110680.1 [Botrytis cinerea T4]